ncbi:hypothetical protein EV360DRAFT_97823 [Lentinula raphanica]|nr:hypothetical protein EV360DRAFT_97823 [Lentinula raphanica]
MPTMITTDNLHSTPLVGDSASFSFFRRRSPFGVVLLLSGCVSGGDLHWIWEPYGIYQNVRLPDLYGIPALEDNNGFTNAQSLMNILETILNLTYLYLAHISLWPPATLIGFGSAALTLSKTMLYWAQEYFCGFCATGQNDLGTLVVYWVVPNGLWLLFPGLIVYTLGKDLVGQLVLADRAATAAVARKSE